MKEYLIEYEYYGGIRNRKLNAENQNEVINIFTNHIKADIKAIYELTPVSPTYPSKDHMIEDIIQNVTNYPMDKLIRYARNFLSDKLESMSLEEIKKEWEHSNNV